MLGVQNTPYYRISGAQNSDCHCSSDGGVVKLMKMNCKHIFKEKRIAHTVYHIRRCKPKATKQI